MKRKQQGTGPSSPRLDTLDRKLIHLLAERSQAMSGKAKKRKESDRSFVDPEQEKRLWGIWRQGVEEHGLNERLMRRIFNLINSLAYEQAERREDWSMTLRPRRGLVDIDIPGPIDTLSTRMWLYLAAGAGQGVRIEQAVLNDDLIELIKACNQAGAEMAWDQEGVESGRKGPGFDHASVFAGQNVMNFYALLLMAVTSPCVCRFNGGTRLKSESMTSVSQVLSSFGARLVSLVPGSEGVPIRVESSGQVPDGLQLPEQAPDELILALLSLAPVWAGIAGGFRLTLPQNRGWSRYAWRVESIWSQSGVTWHQEGQDVEIRGGDLELPGRPEPVLDPLLSGYVLAMPAFQGGQACLQGRWPGSGPEQEALVQICAQAGVELDVLDRKVKSACRAAPSRGGTFDCRQAPGFLPLALALAVSLSEESSLSAESGEDLDFATHVLSGLGMESEQRSAHEILVRPARGRQKEPLAVTAPNACWSLGLALLALTGAEVCIKNPGALTGLWPQFWPLFKALPHPHPKALAPEQKSEEEEHVHKRRRRIVE